MSHWPVPSDLGDRTLGEICPSWNSAVPSWLRTWALGVQGQEQDSRGELPERTWGSAFSGGSSGTITIQTQTDKSVHYHGSEMMKQG